jgi:hypothetical protein
MAKKQTRRSISVSRTTYERLKAFCETNHISMSHLVETRVNDFLGTDVVPAMLAPSMQAASSMSASSVSGVSSASGAPFRPLPPRVATVSAPSIKPIEARPVPPAPAPAAPAPPAQAAGTVQAVPMTSAAARFAVEPPLPIIKPRQDTAAPKPAEKRPEQIFTF